MRIATIGFAIVLVGLGVIGLDHRDYLPLWLPRDGTPEWVGLMCSAVSIAGGIGLLVRPRAAALGLLIYMAAWTVVMRGHDFIEAPASFGAYDGLAEAMVLVVAVWLIFTPRGARIAHALYGLALIPFGLAHFLYFERTVSMVPSWLPLHSALAAFTGGAFIAAGIAIVSGVLARLAAILVAVQITAFTLLVYVSLAELGPFEWIELGFSAALAAAAYVIAASYRAAPAPR